jgi:hypothetical protein
MLQVIATSCAALALASTTGCSRAVLVNEGSPMRVGPDCKTKVYTMTDTGWELSPNRVVIPEGWYVVPPSFVEEPK